MNKNRFIQQLYESSTQSANPSISLGKITISGITVHEIIADIRNNFLWHNSRLKKEDHHIMCDDLLTLFH